MRRKEVQVVAREEAETKRLPQAGGSAEPEPLFLGHESFFRADTDGLLSIQLGGVRDIASLKTYEEQVEAAVGFAAPSGAFFEFDFLMSGDRHPTWNEFLALRNAQILPAEVFDRHFEKDFTAFVYRDHRGIWPGYVLKLKKGATALTLQSVVQPLENHVDGIRNLFVISPGESGSGFRDAQLSGQPIRALEFSNPASTFAYGWFYAQYFILSTSEDGMKQALLRL